MTYNHSFCWDGERTVTKEEFHSLSRVSWATGSNGDRRGAPALYSASPAAKNVFIWPEKATGSRPSSAAALLFCVSRYGPGKICHSCRMIWDGRTGELIV